MKELHIITNVYTHLCLCMQYIITIIIAITIMATIIPPATPPTMGPTKLESSSSLPNLVVAREN